MPKFTRLSDILKERIDHGDYAFKDLPTERQLALEAGVSRMTARRALQQLAADGYLADNALTSPTSRVKRSEPKTRQIALLHPAYYNTGLDRWHRMLKGLVTERGWQLRPVQYVHWNDSFILDTLSGFDGVFLIASTETMPKPLLDRLAAAPYPLIALDFDLTHIGVPSVEPVPPGGIRQLMDHLYERGFRKIGLMNVQPAGPIIERRIEQCLSWAALHEVMCTLIDEPVKPYEAPIPRAHAVAKAKLASGELNVDVVVGITIAATIGAMRAMQDVGISPGHDIAVCAIGGEGIAEYHIPSITTLDVPDRTAELSKGLDWIESGEPWSGPLLMLNETILAVRESTTMWHGPEQCVADRIVAEDSERSPIP